MDRSLNGERPRESARMVREIAKTLTLGGDVMRKLLTALALMGTLSDAQAASQPRLDPTIAAIV